MTFEIDKTRICAIFSMHAFSMLPPPPPEKKMARTSCQKYWLYDPTLEETSMGINITEYKFHVSESR